MPKQYRWALKQELDYVIKRLHWVCEKLDKFYGIYAGDGTSRSKDFYNLRIKVLSVIQKLVELRDSI